MGNTHHVSVSTKTTFILEFGVFGGFSKCVSYAIIITISLVMALVMSKHTYQENTQVEARISENIDINN